MYIYTVSFQSKKYRSAVFQCGCSNMSISLCFLISLQRHRALKYRPRQSMDSLRQQSAPRLRDKKDQSNEEEVQRTKSKSDYG